MIAPLNLLFVCSRNQWRSPTAERIYRDSPEICARSAGVSSSAQHRVSARDLEWADIVFVMEKEHRSALLQRFGELAREVPIEVLDIPDDYLFMDLELVADIEEKVSARLSELGS